MKKIYFIIGLLSLMVGVNACKSNGNSNTSSDSVVAVGDNSNNALDWPGTYSGTIPCKDCLGIQIQVTLNADNTYKASGKYLNEDGSESDYGFSGKIQWKNNGGTVLLEGLNADKISKNFLVGEDKLVQLDSEGKAIESDPTANYTLAKVDMDLVEKYWKLTELMGEPVVTKGKDAYITFKVDGNRVIGNGGCNNLFGTYQLGVANRLSFSQIASSMMMCMDNMETEDGLKKALGAADSYYLQSDTLILNKGRMAPLARFVSVVM